MYCHDHYGYLNKKNEIKLKLEIHFLNIFDGYFIASSHTNVVLQIKMTKKMRKVIIIWFRACLFGSVCVHIILWLLLVPISAVSV